MSQLRKLQTEIDRTLRKINEGIDAFNETWDKVHNAVNANQKEKYEGDLKKEIKKLQRYRDQVKTWMSSNDIKDKTSLANARRMIEQEMERFKVCEKETKTKAYSKEGLQAQQKIDPEEAAREETRCWVGNCLETLRDQVDLLECQMEALRARHGNRDQEQQRSLQENIDNHNFHQLQLEKVLRTFDNGVTSIEDIEQIKEGVEYFLEENQNPDFMHDEFLYEDLNLDAEVMPTPAAPTHAPSEEPTATTTTTTVSTPKARARAQPTPVFNPPNQPARKTRSVGSPQPVAPVSRRGSASAAASPAQTRRSAPSPSPDPVKSAGRKAPSAPSPAPVGRVPIKPTSTRPASGALSYASAATTATTKRAASAALPPTAPQQPPRAPAAPPHGVTPASPRRTAPVPASPRTRAQAPTPSSPVVSIARRAPPSPSPAQQPAPSSTPATTALASTPAPTPAPAPASTSAPTTTTTPAPAPVSTTPALAPAPAPTPAPASARPPSPAAPPAAAPSTEAQKAQQPKEEDAQTAAAATIDELISHTVSMKLDTNRSRPPSSPAVAAAPSPAPPAATTTTPAPAPAAPSGDSHASGTTGVARPTLHPNGQPPVPPRPAHSASIEKLRMLDASFRSIPTVGDTLRDKPYAPRFSYATPACFPQQPLKPLRDPQFFGRFHLDTLFYAFYGHPGQNEQYLAAQSLKKNAWRFHKKYNTWFQRHSEPSRATDEYEDGTYVYFDYETGWHHRIKDKFRFEYKYLEDEFDV
eukprot:gnl/Trimastix_PCT/1765.p1 GENE.gnl/Trimastix_PCT/1765~~gnl/Trimastix_PCT/1765.p1  ORF type:complete len:755 (-),score=162.44 gnl/Trimastix_PCT/1765:306-2570(-)